MGTGPWTRTLSYEELENCRPKRNLDVDVDTALHVVSVAILGRESKMLLDADEIHNPKTLELNQWEKGQTS